MADMVWRPRFDAEELAQEREIVLEEIAMYEDDPQDKVFDVLGEAVFGDHPLGRAIIGRAEVVGRRRPRRGCAAFHAARYVPAQRRRRRRRLGRPRRARRARPARRGRARRRRPPPAPPAPPAATSRRACASSPRTPSSTTSASARPGLARDDERRFALRVLDNVLGGTSSSRLFQEVREKRGLAYTVYSFQSHVRRARARSGSTSARGPTTSSRRCASWPTSSSASARTRPATDELARAQGERQGPHRAVARVDDGADEPPRRLGPGRPAAAVASTRSSSASTP